MYLLKCFTKPSIIVALLYYKKYEHILNIVNLFNFHMMFRYITHVRITKIKSYKGHFMYILSINFYWSLQVLGIC